MELNLKKARKLEGKIQAVLNELKVDPSVTLRAKANSAWQEVNSARDRVLKNLRAVSNLSDARFQLRLSIGSTNEKVGINALMNDRERLLADLANVNRLVTAETTTEAEVADLLDAKRSQLSVGHDTYGSLKVTISVPCLEKDDIEYFKKQAKAVKDRIEEIEDELVQKNAGAKVTLSDSTVALLKEYSLV